MSLESRLEGLADQAEKNWQEPGNNNENESAKADQSLDTAPDMSFKGTQNEPSFDKQPQQTAQEKLDQAIMDLSKADKVMFEGKEWTRDELKRAIMRQEDYTRKTQELSRQRQEFENYRTQLEQQVEQSKYENNYSADLRKVLNNPALMSEFFSTYPKEYHSKLLGDLQRYGQEGQGQQSRIDPVLAKTMAEMHEMKSKLSSYEEQRQQADAEFIDSRLKSLETTLSQKYPKANLETVYAKLDLEAQQQGLNFAQIRANPQLIDQAMDKLMKESHESFLKSYEAYAKEQSRKQIEANKKGSDVGKGGGTPNAPQPKAKLKDVDMYSAMKSAGAFDR